MLFDAKLLLKFVKTINSKSAFHSVNYLVAMCQRTRYFVQSKRDARKRKRIQIIKLAVHLRSLFTYRVYTWLHYDFFSTRDERFSHLSLDYASFIFFFIFRRGFCISGLLFCVFSSLHYLHLNKSALAYNSSSIHVSAYVLTNSEKFAVLFKKQNAKFMYL